MLAGGILAATILTLISGAALAEESSDPYRLTPPGLDEPPRASSQSGAALAAECDAKAAQLVDAERGLTLDTSPPPPFQTLKQIAFLWIGGGILSKRGRTRNAKLVRSGIPCAPATVGPHL
jgi:hypothetical protein